MKLITELTEDIKYIKENTGNGDKNYFIEGTFMQSGVKNKNGRVYPQGTLAKETNRYINEYVNKANITAMGAHAVSDISPLFFKHLSPVAHINNSL